EIWRERFLNALHSDWYLDLCSLLVWANKKYKEQSTRNKDLRSQLLPELEPLNLPGCCIRQLINKNVPARLFEARQRLRRQFPQFVLKSIRIKFYLLLHNKRT